MIKGLYASVSAMMANTERQKVLSHNAANMETPGFKQILTAMGDFNDTTITFPNSRQPNPVYMEQVGMLGLGTQVAVEVSDHQQGSMQQTENELDVAISGDGFFKVRTPNGDLYTRDGRFFRDVNNRLVTVEGYFVLSQDNQPIDLPEDGMVSISPTGQINVEGNVVATLSLDSFKDPRNELTRDDGNHFKAAGNPTGENKGSLHQGFLEMPNVDAASLMTQMVTVGRMYDASQRMVQVQDELLGKTISSVSRI